MCPSSLPFAFGMNEFTTQPWSFEEDVVRYAALGVEAIELCEQKLDPARYLEQLALLDAQGISVSAVQPLVRTFFSSQMQPTPDALRARVDRLTQSLEQLAPFTPGASFIVNTGAPRDGNMAEAMDTVVQELKRLGPLAERLGVQVALEPLNPTAMNVESTIWTTQQALDIVEAVDHPAVGVCFDAWNVWQEPDLQRAILRARGRLFVVQVSDWRTPRSGQDRLVPGAGDMPLGQILHWLYDADYRGVCTVEIFSSHVDDSLYDGDLEEVIRASRRGLHEAWAHP